MILRAELEELARGAASRSTTCSATTASPARRAAVGRAPAAARPRHRAARRLRLRPAGDDRRDRREPAPRGRVAPPGHHGAVRVLMRKAVLAALVVTAVVVVLLVVLRHAPADRRSTRSPRCGTPAPRRAAADADAAAAPARLADREGPAAARRRSRSIQVAGVRCTAGRLIDVKTLIADRRRHAHATRSTRAPSRSCGEEALKAGSADIDTVTGATDTSESWIDSLTAAIEAAP